MAHFAAGDPGAPADQTSHASCYDQARAPVLVAREADWRNGPIVYQVIVDRFVPSADLDAKRALYPPPKRLRPWRETPEPGEFLEEVGVWSHEIDFWGGDLQSLTGKLDYVEELGADVLYLNPIHQAYTNHKYDAQDFFEVSPEYGTRVDLKVLADALHERDMRLVLDGVFNHMGRTAPWFEEAMSKSDSPRRDWFFIGEQYTRGYRAWANVVNLPELRVESKALQARIYGDSDSVVQGFLKRDGVDGWRLDVAPELGFAILSDLTRAAHEAKAGSLVVGENWVYPEEWSPAMDGVLNFHFWQIIHYLVAGTIGGAHAGRMLDVAIADTGLEPLLKSWIILDNHDLPRLRTQLPETRQRRLAQVLQFTLPGAPCLYYGVELGMEGAGDPYQRAPMRWDLVADDNEELAWMRRLIALRRGNRALRIGDFRLLDTEKLLAFMRRTERVAETTVVVVNAGARTVREVLPVRDSKLMNWEWMQDGLSEAKVRTNCGLIDVSVPPQTAWVLQPVIDVTEGHGPYKRVQ